MIEDLNSATFYIIDEYQNNNEKLLELLEDINLGNLEELERMSVDLIMNDIDADFTRPVSDLYWLNQIKKSKKYQEFFDMFNNLEMSNFSELTNQLNKENMQRLLDNSILEKIIEERNKQKTAYKPSELEPRTQLNEKDFLFTNQEERKLLLEQTYQLGKKLAIKYKRFIKDSNKGHLYFRRTIRKSLESGGSFEKLIFKPRIKKKPKLTILCDISGSMALNSLFGVTLLYGMVSKFKSIKAFVFIDGATEISKTLRLIKGTLIVIGDARNNYRNISEDLIEDLDEKYKKIFWINPEQSKYWNTGDSQMKKFEEINYKTVEVRNYKQLKDFIKEIDLKKVLSLRVSAC